MSGTASGARAHTLHNLQAIRALAAFLVLYHHYIDYPPIAIDDWYGAVGVDIFFVISGFVIAYAKRGTAMDFFVRRVIRIVPLYWALTLLWVALAIVLRIGGSGLAPETITFELVLKSLLFIPDQPIITRGWTLNYEMYFYLLFAVSMMISRSMAALYCLLMITAIFLFVNAIDLERPLKFYGSMHVFQFMMGSGAYYIWRDLGRHPAVMAVLRRGRFVLLAATALLLLACCWTSDYYRDSSLVAVTVVSGLFVLAVVSLEEYGGLRVQSRLLTLLGDASYSIYLVHRFVYAPMARKIFPYLAEQSVWAKLLAFVPIAAVVAAVSVAVHLLFEKPVTRFLSDHWRRVSGASRDQAAVAAVEWGKR